MTGPRHIYVLCITDVAKTYTYYGATRNQSLDSDRTHRIRVQMRLYIHQKKEQCPRTWLDETIFEDTVTDFLGRLLQPYLFTDAECYQNNTRNAFGMSWRYNKDELSSKTQYPSLLQTDNIE